MQHKFHFSHVSRSRLSSTRCALSRNLDRALALFTFFLWPDDDVNDGHGEGLSVRDDGRDGDGDGFVGASNLLCNCLCQKQREQEIGGGGRKRVGQTFGALITSMRKCFKCDRSQKRRRLLSGNAVKGSQHFALPRPSRSLFCHLCAMASRRHFVFRITITRHTKTYCVLRQALTLTLEKTLSRCICRVSLSCSFHACLSLSLFLTV